MIIKVLVRLIVIAALTAGFSSGEQEAGRDDVSILNANFSWWHPSGNNTTPANTKNESDSHSCYSYNSCNSCNDANWCHWCEFDNACHAIGSIHGCMRGSDCLPPPPPPPPSNDSCAALDSCASCSSFKCHWCAHDNACHAIGSVYGCVAGVDCYSNERCMRREPESLIPKNATHSFIDQVAMSLSQISFLPLMVLMGLILSCVCCASLCFCFSSGVKGAYDDLVAVYDDARDDTHPLRDAALRRPLLHQSPVASLPSTPVATAENAVEEGATQYVQLGQDSDHEEEEYAVDNEVNVADGNNNNHHHQWTTPLLMQRHRHFVPRHMQRMFNYCRLFYVLTLMTILGCGIGAILYYPKIPSYNVCNDAVAWSSLINSLTALKATADFEILVSVSNPNKFALALDHGMGSFTHNGAFVGTYDIPPMVAAPMAISDLLIVAHLAPDKWDALGLVAEYYRGKLVLYVDAEATLRVPMLANYTITTALKNIVVNVNEQSERHLCACPNWKDFRDVGILENEWTDDIGMTMIDEPPFVLPLDRMVENEASS
ncbi:hypothetical protein MPSEU_000569700 [Mayamaea pseudoterrestris]|nr:hypothetical protein MPSEU_000569700 [Mayamaea pseudoterrestris]